MLLTKKVTEENVKTYSSPKGMSNRYADFLVTRYYFFGIPILTSKIQLTKER